MNIETKFEGLDEVYLLVDRYAKNMTKKANELIKLLGRVGIDVATVKFRQAQYDGNNDVKVSPRVKFIGDCEAEISASGNTVLFIEFGTGITYDDSHPKADELGMKHGTYGQGKGKQETWVYYGQEGTNGYWLRRTKDGRDVYATSGNPPAMAMCGAVEEMKKQVLWAAKEVFTGD